MLSEMYEPPGPSFWEGASGPARRLLDAGVMCFAAAGFHGTTTRDITAGAGLSPASLYVHFPSKEHLLFEIIRTGHARSLEALAEVPDDAPLARVWQLVTTFTEWHARFHTVARTCQYELAALSEPHYREVLVQRHAITETFRVCVAAGVDAGVFEQVDVHRVTRAILSLGLDTVRWYRLGGRDSPADLGCFYADLAMRMLGAQRRTA